MNKVDEKLLASSILISRSPLNDYLNFQDKLTVKEAFYISKKIIDYYAFYQSESLIFEGLLKCIYIITGFPEIEIEAPKISEKIKSYAYERGKDIRSDLLIIQRNIEELGRLIEYTIMPKIDLDELTENAGKNQKSLKKYKILEKLMQKIIETTEGQSLDMMDLKTMFEKLNKKTTNCCSKKKIKKNRVCIRRDQPNCEKCFEQYNDDIKISKPFAKFPSTSKNIRVYLVRSFEEGNIIRCLKWVNCYSPSALNSAQSKYNSLLITTNEHIISILKLVFLQKSKRKFGILMEYCPEGDLNSLIQKKKLRGESFSEPELFNYAYQLLSGLAYLKSLSIYHGSLSPFNIFVSGNGTVLKVGDFSGKSKGERLKCTSNSQLYWYKLQEEIASFDLREENKGMCDMILFILVMFHMVTLGECQNYVKGFQWLSTLFHTENRSKWILI
jgi:serine/threonine protein kinase